MPATTLGEWFMENHFEVIIKWQHGAHTVWITIKANIWTVGQTNDTVASHTPNYTNILI